MNLEPLLRFVVRAKKSVSSGKLNERLSVRSQLIVAAVFPFRSAPIISAITSMGYDMTENIFLIFCYFLFVQ
jgi:hypothetical protein